MAIRHMIQALERGATLYFDGEDFSRREDDALIYRDEDEAFEDAERVGGEVCTFWTPDERGSSTILVQAAE